MAKRNLTDADLEAIKALMEVTIDEKIEEKKLVTRTDIRHLPTKEEFYQSQDELMTEVKTIREEQTVQAHQVSRNAEEITKIKKHLKLPAFD